MATIVTQCTVVGLRVTIRHISVANPNYYDIFSCCWYTTRGSLDPSPFPKRDHLRQEAVGLVPHPIPCFMNLVLGFIYEFVDLIRAKVTRVQMAAYTGFTSLFGFRLFVNIWSVRHEEQVANMY